LTPLSIQIFDFRRPVAAALLHITNGTRKYHHPHTGKIWHSVASYPARSLEHLQVERISGDVAFNNRQRMTRCHGDDYWVVTVQLNNGLDFLLKTTDRKIPNVIE